MKIPYGYQKGSDGTMSIVEKEADIVWHFETHLYIMAIVASCDDGELILQALSVIQQNNNRVVIRLTRSRQL